MALQLGKAAAHPVISGFTALGLIYPPALDTERRLYTSRDGDTLRVRPRVSSENGVDCSRSTTGQFPLETNLTLLRLEKPPPGE